MDLQSIFQSLLASAIAAKPAAAGIIQIFGALVVVGQFIVSVTPSKSDDDLIAKLEAIPFVGDLVKAVAHFAPKWPGSGA